MRIKKDNIQMAKAIILAAIILTIITIPFYLSAQKKCGIPKVYYDGTLYRKEIEGKFFLVGGCLYNVGRIKHPSCKRYNKGNCWIHPENWEHFKEVKFIK